MSEEQQDNGYQQLLTFDTDDPNAVRMFEAGRIWATLRHNPAAPIEEDVHATNAEMCIRMARATNRDIRFDWYSVERSLVTFEPERWEE